MDNEDLKIERSVHEIKLSDEEWSYSTNIFLFMSVINGRQPHSHRVRRGNGRGDCEADLFVQARSSSDVSNYLLPIDAWPT